MMMLPLTSTKVVAEESSFVGNFDTSKNKTTVTAYKGEGDKKNKLMLQIDVKYTRGFDGPTAKYLICEKGSPTNEITSVDHCDESGNKIISESDDGGWVSFVPGSENTISAQLTGTAADEKPTTKSYTIDTGKEITSDNKETYYVVLVKTFYCTKRVLDSDGQYKGGGCQYWHDPYSTGDSPISKIEFKLGDLLDRNITNIENEELSELMDVIQNIVMAIIMPVIYGVLGLFLVIKGAILGFQIVKAADEPQTRQEKIGSLKWLIIGVAIAYAASGLVHVVMGVVSGAFNFKEV
jgi:hypothetical protein